MNSKKLTCFKGEITTVIVYLVSYGILCHCGNIFPDTSYEYVYKYYHPNLFLVHPILVYFPFEHFYNELLSWMIEIWIK